MVKITKWKIFGIIILCITLSWLLYTYSILFYDPAYGMLMVVLPSTLGFVVSIWALMKKETFKKKIEMTRYPYCQGEMPINSVYCPICGARLAKKPLKE